jgi:hypothetical protein
MKQTLRYGTKRSQNTSKVRGRKTMLGTPDLTPRS